MKKIFLAVIATAFSYGLLLITTNLYLVTTGLDQKKDNFIKWTLEGTIYNQRYIYWGKSYCQQNKSCNEPEEKLLTHKVTYSYPINSSHDSNQECIDVLFLGDSFTDSPWTELEYEYPVYFSQLLANHKQQCVKQLRLATGGVNNDQEFLRLKDVLKEIKPDIIIWQFYENDVWENVVFEILKVEKSRIVRRNTFFNSLFLAGFINQRMPFIKNTPLGDYLLYLGERRDVFDYWSTKLSASNLLALNQKKIPLLLKEAEKLSTLYEFDLYTTLSPLECQFVLQYKDECRAEMQNFLRKTLKNNSHYLNMEPIDNIDIQNSSINLSSYFNTSEDGNNPGYRHLSPEGNVFFSSKMFEDFIKVNTDSD